MSDDLYLTTKDEQTLIATVTFEGLHVRIKGEFSEDGITLADDQVEELLELIRQKMWLWSDPMELDWSKVESNAPREVIDWTDKPHSSDKVKLTKQDWKSRE